MTTPQHLDQLDTPALWADLEIMERNLRRMADYARAHRLALRPHIKTHKVPELALRQLALGAVGITSAKVTEAQVMAQAGIEDILIAYPLYGELKWKRLRELAERARVTVATDSAEQAAAMAAALGPDRNRVGLLIEVDLGQGRTGLPLDRALPEQLARIAGSGLPVRGMMVYPGHIRTPDERNIAEFRRGIARAAEGFVAAGLPLETVSGGSTPTAYWSHLVPELTEIRPGTYIFNDCNYVALGAAGWEDCALRVRCRVVSTSVPGRAILDGGSKTFSDAARVDGPGFGRLVQHPAVLCEKMNEEHGYLKLEGAGVTLRVGELVDVIPNHACTTVNMHHLLHGIRDGRVEEVFPIPAQGKIQ